MKFYKCTNCGDTTEVPWYRNYYENNWAGRSGGTSTLLASALSCIKCLSTKTDILVETEE